jgi:hypothetical protein
LYDCVQADGVIGLNDIDNAFHVHCSRLSEGGFGPRNTDLGASHVEA